MLPKYCFFEGIHEKKLYQEKASLIITYQRPEFKSKIETLIKDDLAQTDVFPYVCSYLKSKQLVSTFCCNAVEENDLRQLHSFICFSRLI